MLAKLYSGAVVGLHAVPITVEVDIASKGLPSLTIVGLPDKAVEESRERVRSAIKNSGADYPSRRITINLAPADLPKMGPAYDLPIALGILAASGQIPEMSSSYLCMGELSLDGSVRHINGMLPIVVMAKEKGFTHVFLPKEDAKEGAVIEGVTLVPVTTLLSLVRHFLDTDPIPAQETVSFLSLLRTRQYDCDMADIVGQDQAKRVMEIAAAGAHNMFLRGLPGAGKTMLARIMPTILPPLTEPEAIEVTNIYSVTGNLPSGTSLMIERPFRAPHHTTSQIGLIGGGRNPMPGEISLSHRGVLFLDEFPEFPRSVLEALRQPMEDGIVTISRAAGTVEYPAKFILVAAANPCPCGFYGSKQHVCSCSMSAIEKYKRRISGPILDRIDLHLFVPSVPTEHFTKHTEKTSETSVSIRERIIASRERQGYRLKHYKGIHTNSELSTKLVKELCHLTTESERLLTKAISTFHLSARSYYRTIKVSRTIADLAGEEAIKSSHIAEALNYRPIQEVS